jgi:dCMP deaminase
MHDDYLRMAVMASRNSPDLSTKNGAVLVSRNGNIVRACNSPPPRVPLTDDRRGRPSKYDFIEHAERNAIFMAARQGICTDGARMYCLWYACPHCARAIVTAGVREIVGLLALDVLTPQRWRDSVRIGKEILTEAGVRTRLYTEPLGLKVIFADSEITI